MRFKSSKHTGIFPVIAVFMFLAPFNGVDAGDFRLKDLQSYSLGMSDGLANSSVFCEIQDNAGFMWFGTFGGLSRYDGADFTTWRPRPGETLSSLPASVVFALLEDSKGNLWVGTDGGGLARYDRNKDSFVIFRADSGNPQALSSDKIFSLAEDEKGRIWAGAGNGSLDRLDPGTSVFVHYSPEKLGTGGARVRCLLRDKNGTLWAGTEGGGLLRYDGEHDVFESFRHKEGDSESLADDVIRSMFEDNKGRIWLGLGSGGIDMLSKNKFLHARGKGTLPREAVRALAQDSADRIWVGYSDSGIGILDPETLGVDPPGSALMVRTIHRDNRGLMWVGTKGSGVRTFNLESARFRRYEKTGNGEPLRELRGLAEDGSGKILLGSDGGGLVILDPETGFTSPFKGMPKDYASRKVYSVLPVRSGLVWVGTDGGGLIALKDGKRKIYRHENGKADSLSSDVVWALHEDPDGTIWAGTEGGGLDRLSPLSDSFRHYRFDPGDPSSLRGASIRAIFRDSKGRLWVGAWDGGLSRMDGDSGVWKSYGPDSKNPSSLGDMSVNCIFEDTRGIIWVGTGGSGVAMLDPGTDRFTHLGEAEGLAGETVYGVIEDSEGRIWISTATGLSRYDMAAGIFFNLGREDGLSTSELAQNSLLLSSDGTIWVGGLSGLTRFNPIELPFSSGQPTVVIDGISALEGGGYVIKALDSGTIHLGYGNSGFAFNISVLDFVAPARNRYAMKLEGRQDSWISLGKHGNGLIGPLAPGHYVLKVKGANGNGTWNEAAGTLRIDIKPPFWDEWWFRVLVLALVAAAVLLWFGIRVRGLRKHNALLVGFSRHIETAREDERIAAAREVHDEIGQHLAAINIQAYWLKTHLEADTGSRAQRLGEMSGSITDAMAAVKSVATNLRPIALDALSLDEAFRWYVRSFERRSGIKSGIEIGSGLPAPGGDLSTALFRILQEMLTNVLRHSRASSVEVGLSFRDGKFELEVGDDGIGIGEGLAEARDSFGIIGMRERCALFGGTFTAARGSGGKGTRVSASIPVP